MQLQTVSKRRSDRRGKILAGAFCFTLISCQSGPVHEAVSHKQDYQDAYIYGFPMIAA
jgi:hypothetical protein